jgi:signal transduction histidine kinase
MVKQLEKLLPAIVVLSCLSFPLAIYFQLSPETRTRSLWVQDQFYYVLVAATVGLAFVAFYFAYKEFTLSRRPGVHLISLSFLLLSILLFATSLLGENVRPVLVDSFATHARLLFAIFFLAGVLASSEHRRLHWLGQVPTRTLNWLTAVVAAGGILYAMLLRKGIGGQVTESLRELLREANQGFDGASIALLLAAVITLTALYRRNRNPMALALTTGAAFALEATLLFGAAPTWSITWWMAHGVLLLGLAVLTYGIVLITHTREADELLFDIMFSRAELEAARRKEEQMRRDIELLQFVVTVADSLRHEILNPHTVIAGNAQILLNGKALEEEQRKLVEAMLRKSQQVIELMERYKGLREKVEFRVFDEGSTQIIDLEKSR